MKKIFVYCAIITVAIISLTCSDGPEPMTPNPNPGQNPGAILNITDEQRLAVLEQCSKFIKTIGDLKSKEVQQALVSWLKSRPEFEEAGIEGGNVWAYFYDGRIAMMVPDWKRDPTPGGRVAMPENTGRKEMVSEVARSTGIPAGSSVKLFYGLEKGYQDDRPYLKSLFLKSHTGFNLDQNIELLDATIENFRTVKNVSVLYIDTHGGLGLTRPKRDGVRKYGLITKDLVTNQLEAKYDHELDELHLVYMIAPTSDVEHPVWNYGITDVFVEANMSFKENAIQYIDASDSRTYPANELSQAMLNKTAGDKPTFIGWTGPVDNGTTIPTARFVFDRLLGSQTYLVESPLQRPFDLSSIKADLPRWNLGVSDYGGKFDYETHSTTEVLLTPSIEYITMYDFSSQIFIRGLFGDDPGPGNAKVTVGGLEVKTINWKPNLIQCEIPTVGFGSFGNVIVSVGKNESNIVPLSAWDIPLKIWRDEMGVRVEANLNLRIRGDVHQYREEAGKPLKIERTDSAIQTIPGFKGWQVGTASTGSFTVGGEIRTACSKNGCSLIDAKSIVANTGTLKLNALPTAPSYFAYYTWARDLKKIYIKLAVNVPVIGRESQNYSACPGSPVYDERKSYNEGLVLAIPSNHQPVLEFKLDENYNIQKGGVPWSEDITFGGCELAGKLQFSTQWPTVTPVIIPRQDTEARIGQ